MEIKTHLLILQSTSFCNINCTYCYLPDRNIKSKFELSLLPIIWKNLRESNLLGDKIDICWHAGEPLVLSASYYEEAIKILNSENIDNVKINYHIQTNGMLISNEFCNLFKKYKVNIGVSIDGPEQINDMKRVKRNNRGSYLETMRGILLLKSHGIPFTVIAVVTDATLNHIDEFLEFFKNIGAAQIGVNVEEIEAENIKSSVLTSSENKEAYHHLINGLYDLQVKHRVGVREINHSLQKIVFAPDDKEVYDSQSFPFSIISVDSEGNYSTFSPELLSATHPNYGNFIFGNVKSEKFIDSYKNATFNRINQDIQTGIEMCKAECDYYNVCGGGAPSNKLFENGTFASTTTNYCRWHIKELLDIIADRLENDDNQ